MRSALTVAFAVALSAHGVGAQERDRGEGELGARVGFWLAQEISAPYGALSGGMRFNDHALLVTELGVAQFDAGCDVVSGPGDVGCDDATRIGFLTIGPRFEMGSGASRPFLSFFLGSTLLDADVDGVFGGSAGARIDRPSGFGLVPEVSLQWINRSGGFQRATVLSLGIVYAP